MTTPGPEGLIRDQVACHLEKLAAELRAGTISGLKVSWTGVESMLETEIQLVKPLSFIPITWVTVSSV